MADNPNPPPHDLLIKLRRRLRHTELVMGAFLATKMPDNHEPLPAVEYIELFERLQDFRIRVDRTFADLVRP